MDAAAVPALCNVHCSLRCFFQTFIASVFSFLVPNYYHFFFLLNVNVRIIEGGK